MTEQAGKIVLGYSDETLEWPQEVKDAFVNFVESGYGRNFSVICAVGLNLEDRTLTIRFSSDASSSEYKTAMCEDIAEMFHAMGRRFQQ